MVRQPPRELNPPLVDEAAVARAEAVLEILAQTFESWIDEEVALLTDARAAMKAEGVSLDTIDALSRRAHDLKGQGTTLNYPFVTRIAELLCKLCEHLPDPGALPVSLVDAHVDALRAIVRDGIRGGAHPTGSALVDELQLGVQSTLATWRERASGGH
jgi:chemotaxis protein histidine kinase CheA